MALRTDVTVLARRSIVRKHQKADEGVTALGVIAPPPIQIESPHFSGSLGALFSCVRERKIDLAQVPLLPICEAYFYYLITATPEDLDHAAAALAALAYLLERKAWGLLPSAEAEPEADDAIELIAPSVQEYELAIRTLSMWQEERERFYFRPPDSGPEPYEIPFDLCEVSVSDLARAFERLLAKAEPVAAAPINKPRRSISEQMKVVLRCLCSEFKPLEALILSPYSREDAVYWFLALLELIRLGQVRVKLGREDALFSRVA